MSLESGLDVPDPKLRARVELLVPRLRSDLSQRLAAYTANLPAGAAPNLDLLTPLLQKQVDVTAGQPGARLLIMIVPVNSPRSAFRELPSPGLHKRCHPHVPVHPPAGVTAPPRPPAPLPCLRPYRLLV